MGTNEMSWYCLTNRTMGKEQQNILVFAQPIEHWNEVPDHVSVPHNVIH
jgi:hypothetical protein